MNVLIDSLTCNPNVGSNAESGYGFATQAMKRNTVFLMSHRELFLEGGNPLAFDGSGRIELFLLRPSLLAKLGRQTDYILRCYLHANRLVKQKSIDVIHTVEPTQYCMTRPLALIRGAPFVLGPLNGGDAYPPRSFLDDLSSRSGAEQAAATPPRVGLRRLADAFNHQLVYGGIAKLSTRMAFRVARRIVIGTENCLRNIPSRHHRRCVKVPCFGIDPEKLSPRMSAENERPVILYAGRITEWKGLDLVIRAHKKVCASKDALLRIAGSGRGNAEDERFESYCRGLADELKLEDNVEFLGHVPRDELVGLYRTCDIFCLTSLWEPFGLVYLEAMACGMPVVAMASGGPKEIVKSDFGFAVEPRRLAQFIDDLSEALKELVMNRKKRVEMGERARQHILDEYTWDLVGKKMQAVYEEAV